MNPSNNPLKEKWRGGDCTVGAWLVVPSMITAEVVGKAGYDYVCVDMQHGLADYGDLRAMIPAIELGGSVPIARVPWNEPGIIGRVLDVGAFGVIIPMVNNAADAEAAVAACRFPPDGLRSFGKTRATIGRPGYLKEANESVVCIVMIETAEAISNLDEILSVPGIDVAYIGPSDLSVALGLAPLPHHDNEKFRAALDKVLAACGRHGVTPGMHTNSSLVGRRRQEGFQMLTATADLAVFSAAIETDLATARAATSQPARSPGND